MCDGSIGGLLSTLGLMFCSRRMCIAYDFRSHRDSIVRLITGSSLLCGIAPGSSCDSKSGGSDGNCCDSFQATFGARSQPAGHFCSIPYRARRARAQIGCIHGMVWVWVKGQNVVWVSVYIPVLLRLYC